MNFCTFEEPGGPYGSTGASFLAYICSSIGQKTLGKGFKTANFKQNSEQDFVTYFYVFIFVTPFLSNQLANSRFFIVPLQYARK